MTNPYESANYRKLLADRAIQLKSERAGFTMAKLAQDSGIQPPYLTNVFKEKAHLSADQMFALAELLGFGEDEQNYLSLLLEWERSGNALRKKRLKDKIDEVRKEKLSTKANLKKEVVEDNEENTIRFYLNPYYKILNSFLAVEEFAQDPQKIADCLHQSRHQIDQWLKDLVDMNYARRTPQGFEKIKKNFHLPPESPLCDPHQNLLKRMSEQHQSALPKDEKYNFVLNFSADESAREKVQSEFMKFLKNIEDVVTEAPSDEVYGLSFDLFKWSFDPKKSGGRY